MQTFFSNAKKWFLPFVLGAVGVAYSIYRFDATSYWDGAIGNWIATFLGIVVGVPVALHLEHQRSTKAEAMLKSVEVSAKNRVIKLLLEELNFVTEQMSVRRKKNDSILIMPLRKTTWDALRESGNLKQVSDTEVISVLSTAFYWINLLNEIEQSTFKAIFRGNVIFSNNETASQRLSRIAQDLYDDVDSAVSQAISVLEASLSPRFSQHRNEILANGN